MTVAARWPLLLPAMKFPWFPRRLSADPSPGGALRFRTDHQYPRVFHVAFSDVSISASKRTLRARSDASRDFQRSPLRRMLPKNPLPLRHRCRRFGKNGATVHPRSALSVSHRFDGFRLFDPAHLFHCAASHGIRAISAVVEAASRARCPALRSLLPVLGGLLGLSPESTGASSPPRFQGVHRAPYPLTLR